MTNEQDDLKNEVMKILGRGNVKVDIFEAVERAFKAKQEAKREDVVVPAKFLVAPQCQDSEGTFCPAISPDRCEGCNSKQKGDMRILPGYTVKGTQEPSKPTAPASLIEELDKYLGEATHNDDWGVPCVYVNEINKILSRYDGRVEVVMAEGSCCQLNGTIHIGEDSICKITNPLMGRKVRLIFVEDKEIK